MRQSSSYVAITFQRKYRFATDRKKTRSPSPDEIAKFPEPLFWERYKPERFRRPFLSFWNPKKKYFAEKRRHEREWRSLKKAGIPTDQDDLDAWVEDWSDVHFERTFFCMIPQFGIEEKEHVATFSLLEAIRKGGTEYNKFCSLYTPFLNRRDGADEFNFDFLLWRFKDL